MPQTNNKQRVDIRAICHTIEHLYQTEVLGQGHMKLLDFQLYLTGLSCDIAREMTREVDV